MTPPSGNDWLQIMRLAVGIFLLPLFALWSSPPVPYYGKVAIRGVNYGSAQFNFPYAMPMVPSIGEMERMQMNPSGYRWSMDGTR